MEERQNIVNPFSPDQRYPNGLNASFSKKSKNTPTKRSRTETRKNQKKFCKSRKLDRKHFIPTNTAKPTFAQLPALVTMPPLPQTATTGASIFMQLPNTTAQV